MLKLRELCKEYFENQEKLISVNKPLPISPKKAETPIIPMERWKIVDSALVKKYHFHTIQHRDRFLIELLEYERKIQHNAAMLVTSESITIRINTKKIEIVTELDKEYASFCDSLFKDIILL